MKSCFSLSFSSFFYFMSTLVIDVGFTWLLLVDAVTSSESVCKVDGKGSPVYFRT